MSTQTWVTPEGVFLSRTKRERDDEIARLYYETDANTEDLALVFHVTARRISQIINHRRYSDMRARWAERGEWS